MLIDAFIKYLECEKKYSAHTVLAYKTDLFAFQDFCINEFNQKDIESVNYNQIRSWIVYLVNQQISNRTINRKISSLNTFYKFLQKIEEIKINPLVKHKALKTQKKIQAPFTKQEVGMVIDNIEEGNEDEFIKMRNKLIVELFYSTGMRRAELINLKINDINLYDKIIKVLGKRNKERFIPLLPSVLETLNKYIELRKQITSNCEYLLITLKGVKIYETLVYRIIISYFSNVSTKVKKSPHILRHTFATHLLNQGADLNSVKELLGHSSLAATQVYTSNSLEQLKKVFNQSHPRNKK